MPEKVQIISQIEVRELRRDELFLFVALQMGISAAEAVKLSFEPLIFHSWVIGAWLSGNLVGGVQLVRSTDQDSAIIIDTRVDPPLRNIGIGSLLHRKREDFLQGFGINKTISVISIANAPSMNCSINKNGSKGVRYLRDCYFLGEDKLLVEKELTKPFNVIDETKAENRYRLIEISQRDTLESYINHRGYCVAGILRPEFSGYSEYMLALEGGD